MVKWRRWVTASGIAVVAAVVPVVVSGATTSQIANQPAVAATTALTVGATADTTATRVPQDGDPSARTTLATCPSRCDGNPNGERSAVVQFTVAGIPAGATVTGARLQLSTWTAATAKITAYSAQGGATGTGSASPWPVFGAALASTGTVVAGYNSWPVTLAVTGNGSYTFALRQTSPNTRLYFASKENSNTAIRPRLAITYQPAGSTASPTAGSSTSATAAPTTGASTSATATPTAGPSGSTSGTPSTAPTTSTAPSTSASPAPTATVPGWNLVWSDEFNGTSLDPSKWNARNNTYVDYDLSCITNRPENISVSGGVAILRAQKETATCGSQTRNYTEAYLDSIGKASFTRGRFEVRAKSPTGPTNSTGIWPAFWLRPDDGGNGELDVVELPGGASYYKAATQAIFHDYTPTKQDHRWAFPSGNPSDGFHTYTTEWEPTEMRWYIDGTLVWTRDTTTTSWYTSDFSRPFHLRLNIQVGGWLGNPDATTTFPAEFLVDYVRVWQR